MRYVRLFAWLSGCLWFTMLSACSFGQSKPLYGASDSMRGIEEKAKMENQVPIGVTDNQRLAAFAANRAAFDRYQLEVKRIKYEANMERIEIRKEQIEVYDRAIAYLDRNPHLPTHLSSRYDDLFEARKERTLAKFERASALEQAKYDYAYRKIQDEKYKHWDLYTYAEKIAINKETESKQARLDAANEKLKQKREKVNELVQKCELDSDSYNSLMDSWNAAKQSTGSRSSK